MSARSRLIRLSRIFFRRRRLNIKFGGGGRQPKILPPSISHTILHSFRVPAIKCWNNLADSSKLMSSFANVQAQLSLLINTVSKLLSTDSTILCYVIVSARITGGPEGPGPLSSKAGPLTCGEKVGLRGPCLGPPSYFCSIAYRQYSVLYLIPNQIQ